MCWGNWSKYWRNSSNSESAILLCCKSDKCNCNEKKNDNSPVGEFDSVGRSISCPSTGKQSTSGRLGRRERRRLVNSKLNCYGTRWQWHSRWHVRKRFLPLCLLPSSRCVAAIDFTASLLHRPPLDGSGGPQVMNENARDSGTDGVGRWQHRCEADQRIVNGNESRGKPYESVDLQTTFGNNPATSDGFNLLAASSKTGMPSKCRYINYARLVNGDLLCRVIHFTCFFRTSFIQLCPKPLNERLIISVMEIIW